MAKPLDMNGTAEALGVSRRALQSIIQRFPYFYANGRKKLFTLDDVEKIRNAMRAEAQQAMEQKQCHSKQSRQEQENRPIGPFEERIAGSMWKEAQKRLTQNRQKPCAKNGKTTSTVLPLSAYRTNHP